MEEQKKNLDIRVILNQLNIPMDKFEEWKTRETAENRSLKSNAWMIGHPQTNVILGKMTVPAE